MATPFLMHCSKKLLKRPSARKHRGNTPRPKHCEETSSLWTNCPLHGNLVPALKVLRVMRAGNLRRQEERYAYDHCTGRQYPAPYRLCNWAATTLAATLRLDTRRRMG